MLGKARHPNDDVKSQFFVPTSFNNAAITHAIKNIHNVDAFPQYNGKFGKSVDNNVRTMFVNYLYALSPSARPKVTGALKHYNENMPRLVNKLSVYIQNRGTTQRFKVDDLHIIENRILNTTLDKIKEKTGETKKSNSSRTNSKFSPVSILKGVVYNWKPNELYKIIKINGW